MSPFERFVRRDLPAFAVLAAACLLMTLWVR